MTANPQPASAPGSARLLPPAKTALARLSAVNWDFKTAVTNGDTHSFHPYPARFIPQIPQKLITAFTRPGDTVYDPFVGCGTTCVEANLAGRNALACDASELAVLITRVKTTPLPATATKDIPKILSRISRQAQTKEFVTAPPGVAVEWFEDFVTRELTIIKNEIDKMRSKPLRNFLRVALSAVIVGVSRQDSDTRYVRVPKNLAPMDTILRFGKKAQKMLKAIALTGAELKRGQTDARTADSRIPGVFGDDSADFAVTSPPYPNAYDYHLYHRHRLLWLGMDPSDLKKKEIGAHAHYSKKNGMNAENFYRDMVLVFGAMGRVLKYKKHLAVVIGDSILHGKRIDNAKIITLAAADAGFHAAGSFSRRLNSQKKSFHPSHGNIADEKILIFRNQKK